MPPRCRSPHPRVAGLLLALLVAPEAAAPQARTILLATTTSTRDSGLLDALVPAFERKTGYLVKTIAVGTGQALAMGKRGEADVLLVHSPEAELVLVREGWLIHRRPFMHNDFVLVGPPADPARARGLPIGRALVALVEAGALFVSRGDDSGTHKMEQRLWREAGRRPGGARYLEAGQGMGPTLRIASEKGAYTLTDRGTFLALRGRLTLEVLVEGDAALLNRYSVLEVNPARHPKVNAAGGKALADFLISPEAQEAIRTFGVDRYGQPLFFPDAGKPEPGGG